MTEWKLLKLVHTQLMKSFILLRNTLLRNRLKKNGLLVSDVKFTDKVIRTIINSYTREAGVRES